MTTCIYNRAVNRCCYYDFTAHLPLGGNDGSWSEFFLPLSLHSSWPVWLAAVSFGTQHRFIIRLATWTGSWVMWGRWLILIKQACLAKNLLNSMEAIGYSPNRHNHRLTRGYKPAYLSFFSSAWYIRSQESGTFWLLQGRLLLLLTLFLRLKLFLRTDWLLFSPLLVLVFFPVR